MGAKRRVFWVLLAAALPGSGWGAEPLATIGGHPVTEADIAGKGGMKAQMACYEARKEAVDAYLYDHLSGLEAKKAGTTPEKLLEAEVAGKVRRVTDADIRKFYDDFKKQGRGNAPPLEQISERIREKLEQDRRKERQEDYFAELRRKHKVAYLFQRPTVAVATGNLPAKGAEKAPVTIVEFSDFECPYCKRGAETVEEVLRSYRGKVKLYFRDYPLPFHKRAVPAAQAARCANEQGKFWPYHDKLFQSQSKLADEDLLKHAEELKLDKAKFEACYRSGKHRAAVEADMKEGSEAGVTGTPAFFINGVPLSGAQPFGEFKAVIDEQLAAKGVSSSKEARKIMP